MGGVTGCPLPNQSWVWSGCPEIFLNFRVKNVGFCAFLLQKTEDVKFYVGGVENLASLKGSSTPPISLICIIQQFTLSSSMHLERVCLCYFYYLKMPDYCTNSY